MAKFINKASWKMKDEKFKKNLEKILERLRQVDTEIEGYLSKERYVYGEKPKDLYTINISKTIDYKYDPIQKKREFTKK